jgi:ribosome maturation factor RimP
MGTVEAVERAIAPVLSSLEIELVDVEAHRGLVKVTIDRAPALDLESLTKATAAVSQALDVADAVPGGRYELEVTSPGLERRLRRPDHFRRFVGSEIAVVLKPGSGSVEAGAARRFEGRLAAADSAGIVVEGRDEPEGGRRIPYGDIDRAHTVFDWRAALASSPSSPPRSERKAARPSAADRSRAAATAAAARSSSAGRSTSAGTMTATGTGGTQDGPKMTDDDDVTEIP